MKIWLNNHLSPSLARWLAAEFGEPCLQVRELGLARAADKEIFEAAAKAARVFCTKDRDFADLVKRVGPPPQVLLLTLGNTSTEYLTARLREEWAAAMTLIAAGEPIVEIGGRD